MGREFEIDVTDSVLASHQTPDRIAVMIEQVDTSQEIVQHRLRPGERYRVSSSFTKTRGSGKTWHFNPRCHGEERRYWTTIVPLAAARGMRTAIPPAKFLGCNARLAAECDVRPQHQL